jgi:ABC-type multidrug transport system fused ATPase/permease subunit
MNFLPLGILLIVDVILITFTVIDKLRDRYKKKGHLPRGRGEKRAFLAKGAGRFSRSPAYQELDDEQYHGFTDNDLPMEPNIRVMLRRPTGFEQLGSLETDFAEELHNDAGDQKTDLHLFVQSLSKCLGATKFGLSFEFQDLGFKPPKSSKPILADVSGTIHAGSLWGVMGASGAGKCEFQKLSCSHC